MTVNTTNITSGPYPGNGVSSTFSYTFRVTDKTQLKVYETDDVAVRTLLTVDTDYTVANIGDANGGIITRVAGALPTNYEWYIRSDYKSTQLTALPSQGAFFPDIHEDVFDKLTFLVQQLNDIDNRSFRVSDAIDIDGTFTIVQDALARANTFLAFDNSGNLIVSSGTASVPVSVYMATVVASADAFEAIGLLKSSYVVATKALAVALTIEAGRKVLITSGDGGEFTMRAGAVAGTYNDNGDTACGTTFTAGDGSSGFLRDYDGYLNTKWFGTKGDEISLSDGVVTGTAFSSASASFTSADVGKTVVIFTAGVSSSKHRTTFAAYVSATAMTLTAAPSINRSGVTTEYGTDNTAAFRLAADTGEGSIWVPDGTYLVNAVSRLTDPVTAESIPGAIQPKSDQSWFLSRGCTIKQQGWFTGDDVSAAIFGVYSVDNVLIHGGKLEGNYTIGADDPTRTGEGHHGIHIGNSTNVTVENLYASKCRGDGITISYIGNLTTADNSKNVSLMNVTCELNYRNAMSSVGSEGLRIIGGAYKNTSGASPNAGIDLEPNVLTAPLMNGSTTTSKVYDTVISGAEISGNADTALQITNPQTQRTTVTGCTFSGNNTAGGDVVIYRASEVTMTGNTFKNDSYVNITVRQSRNVTIDGNVLAGDVGDTGGGVYIKGEGTAITAITKANPGVITSAGHSFVSGDIVELENIGGMTELNGQKVTVTYISSSTFSIGVNTSGYTTYTSAGVVTIGTWNISVSNNIIYNRGKGIEATTQNSPALGYPVNNINIIGNQITDCASEGITTFNIDELKVLKNSVLRTAIAGIKVSASTYHKISGNTVNTVAVSTTGHGIWLEDSVEGSVDNNDVNFADHHGIFIDTSNRNNVVGNHIMKCGQATTNTWNGIHVVVSDNNNIQTNQVYAGTSIYHKYGIRIDDASCDWNFVTNNYIRDSSFSGSFSDAGANTQTTAGNM